MKRTTLVFLLMGTALLSLAGAGGREPGPMPLPIPSPYRDLSAATGAKFDRLFIGEMIVRQNVNVTLANSTFYGGKNPEVKAFAGQVKQTHSASIARLRSWGGGQSSIMDIVGPQGDYDTWFLTFLPRQNEQLRQLLRLVPSHTSNTSLRQFAAQLLPQLAAEDARARVLLARLK